MAREASDGLRDRLEDARRGHRGRIAGQLGEASGISASFRHSEDSRVTPSRCRVGNVSPPDDTIARPPCAGYAVLLPGADSRSLLKSGSQSRRPRAPSCWRDTGGRAPGGSRGYRRRPPGAESRDPLPRRAGRTGHRTVACAARGRAGGPPGAIPAASARGPANVPLAPLRPAPQGPRRQASLAAGAGVGRDGGTCLAGRRASPWCHSFGRSVRGRVWHRDRRGEH